MSGLLTTRIAASPYFLFLQWGETEAVSEGEGKTVLVYDIDSVDHADCGEPVGSVWALFFFYGGAKGRSEEPDQHLQNEPDTVTCVSRYGVGFIRNADRGRPLGILTTKGDQTSGESREAENRKLPEPGQILLRLRNSPQQGRSSRSFGSGSEAR
jgi:hypothetical protein